MSRKPIADENPNFSIGITGKGRKYLDDHGREMPDPVPMAPPIGYKKAPSLAQQIRTMVQSENLANAARSMDKETFEESEDFEVGDDYDPHSPYENDFDPPVEELIAAGREALDKKAADQKAASISSKAASLSPEEIKELSSVLGEALRHSEQLDIEDAKQVDQGD